MCKRGCDGLANMAADCPCENSACSIRGDCVQCVSNHRKSQAHLPECLQDMMRPLVEEFARKLELRTSEGRPVSDKK